jgi:hypothetical protein
LYNYIMSEVVEGWGPGLGSWGQAEPMRHLFPLLAYDLVDSPDPYGAAADAGLPIPPQRRYGNATEFFEQAAVGIAEFQRQGIEQFFVSTRPISEDDPLFTKRRALGVPADEIVDQVRTWLGNDSNKSYAHHGVQVAEYAKAAYGGIITVNRQHDVRIEAVDNEMGALATGLQTPKYIGESNEFGVVKFEFDNPQLINALCRALRCIPSSRGSRRELDPCNAEFSLIRRRGILAPVFFDNGTSRAVTALDMPQQPWRLLEERARKHATKASQ